MEKEKKTPAAIELKNAGDENKKEITPGMIRRVTITVGKREIPLRYTLRTQVQMEEELEKDYTELMEALRKRKTTALVVRLLRILGNEGLKWAGQEADLTDEWIRCGLWAVRLNFSTESPRECVDVAEAYIHGAAYRPNGMTRGAYLRGVE